MMGGHDGGHFGNKKMMMMAMMCMKMKLMMVRVVNCPGFKLVILFLIVIHVCI